MPNGVREVFERCTDAECLSAFLSNTLNLRDLYALLAVQATLSWLQVPERCGFGNIISYIHALACSRSGQEANFFILTCGRMSL